jgi:peptide/nickel transport system ATP-binding protein/oligopeptide transport system ATP-binding protein
LNGPRHPILRVSALRKEFHIRERGAGRTLTAVDGISLDLYPGETVALVGESGSGKSTVARCIARLVEPTSGDVTLGGVSLTALPKSALPKAYGDLQMVFQDPTSSLNPRMTVRTAIEEPLRLHFTLSRAERDDRVRQLIEAVELSDGLLDRYPRQLSGGQRQRVGIARALAVEPKVVLLDEPTASLDVSIRGQILELLGHLQREKGLAYLFITHDLETVRAIADRVLVMYLGSILEQGPTEMVFDHPTHPYTRALLSSAPVPEYGRQKERFVLKGEIPSPIDLPTGCRLATRCPLAQARCSASIPPLVPVAPGHAVACPVVLEASQPRPTGAPVGPHAASVSSK